MIRVEVANDPILDVFGSRSTGFFSEPEYTAKKIGYRGSLRFQVQPLLPSKFRIVLEFCDIESDEFIDCPHYNVGTIHTITHIAHY